MQMLSFVCLDISCKHDGLIPPPCISPMAYSSSCDDPSSLLSLVERCDCRNFTHNRCHQHAVTYIATTQHLIYIISRQVTNNTASSKTLLISCLHTQTFPHPLDTAGAQWHAARPISARLPWPRRRLIAAASPPGLGELQCSCCMICATPPAPPPTHHHHHLFHPSILIHPHCQPPCSRYYHFSRPHILFFASDQSLFKIATPPIARPPSRRPPCPSCYQTPSRRQTAILRFPSADNH